MKKIIISLLTLVFVFSIATPARAQTPSIAELLALLEQLQKQIAILIKAQEAQTTSDSCISFTRDLSTGLGGSDVIGLQNFLERKGYLVMPAGLAKGYYGNVTQQALARYQSANGISPANGFLGALTRAKINAECVDQSGKGETPISTGLSFSNKSFEFTVTEGETLTNNYKELKITNKSDTNVTLTVRVPRQPSWLNASYTTEEITLYPNQVVGFGVMVDPNGLGVGTYKTELIFEGNFVESPQKVPVILKVKEVEDEEKISLKVSSKLVVNDLNLKKFNISLSGGTLENPVYRWVVNFKCSTGIDRIEAKGGIVCGQDYTFGNEMNSRGDVAGDLYVFLKDMRKDVERLDYTIRAFNKEEYKEIGYKTGKLEIPSLQEDVEIPTTIESTGEFFEGNKRWDGIKLSLNSSDNSRVKMWNVIMSCPSNVGDIRVKVGGGCDNDYYIYNTINGVVIPASFEMLDYNGAIIEFRIEAYDSTDVYRANKIGEINFSHNLAKG